MSPGPAAGNEIASGERFAFGANWARFLESVDEDRIAASKRALSHMLECEDLTGSRFLDAGSGSGLSSLAARRLGARVVSFDYDPASVACTLELRRRFRPHDPDWRVEAGSVLDAEYLRGLGAFDVVYCWGVAHHSGALWDALALLAGPVTPAGALFLAIYNDQGARSRWWRRIKRLYCSGALGRALVCAVFVPWYALKGLVKDAVRGRSRGGAERQRKRRGMSRTRDWFDWLGGYPYEVAKPEQVLAFFRERGFVLEKLRTTNRHGNNEFVFRRPPQPRPVA